MFTVRTTVERLFPYLLNKRSTGECRNITTENTQMAQKYEETVIVRVPKGTREELSRIAERRYVAISSVARQAIMKEIAEERRKEVKAA
jgi:hypothetical protein